jgi:hypothetical protein
MNTDPLGGEHSQPVHLLVGRNRRGQWVVRDQRARCGGLFDSRTEALRFAFRERGEAPGAVVLVPDVLELFEGPSNDPATLESGASEVRAEGPRVLQEV